MDFGQVLSSKEVEAQFIKLYEAIHHLPGAIQWDIESDLLKRAAADNKELLKASGLSVYAFLMDHAFNGLSLSASGGKQQVSAIPQSVNVGTKAAPVYETRIRLDISAYGEVALRIRAGQVVHVDNPVYVYAGDDFTVTNGIPHHVQRSRGGKIEACWVRIVLPNGAHDYKVMWTDEIELLKSSSKNPGSKAWVGGFEGQPMPGMIRAKTLRHAFSTYPRIKIGANSEFADDTDDAGIDLYAQTIAGISAEEDDIATPEPDNTPEPTADATQQPQPHAASATEDNDIF